MCSPKGTNSWQAVYLLHLTLLSPPDFAVCLCLLRLLLLCFCLLCACYFLLSACFLPLLLLSVSVGPSMCLVCVCETWIVWL